MTHTWAEKIILSRLKEHWTFIWPVTWNWAASPFFGRTSKCLDVDRAVSSSDAPAFEDSSIPGKSKGCSSKPDCNSPMSRVGGRYLSNFPEQVNACRARNLILIYSVISYFMSSITICSNSWPEATFMLRTVNLVALMVEQKISNFCCNLLHAF